jgi:hypothetical protein
VIAAFVLLSTYQVFATGFDKPYYERTTSGTWAKYEVITKGLGRYTYEYTRLADQAGRICIGFTMEVLDGPGKGSGSDQLTVLKPGFDFARQGYQFQLGAEVMILQAGEGEPMVQSAEIIEIIKNGMPRYSLVFVGSEMKNGHQCDHYKLSASTEGPRPMEFAGDLWIDAAVPFGLVHEVLITTDKTSNEITETETRLGDFGSGGSGTPTLLAAIPDLDQDPAGQAELLPPPVSLDQAYQSEQIALQVHVVEDSGGNELLLSLSNKTRNPIGVVVAKGQTQLSAGSPLGTLHFTSDEDQLINLPAMEAGPAVRVHQQGARGAVAGRFSLTMYDGEPLLTGSITIGSL